MILLLNISCRGYASKDALSYICREPTLKKAQMYCKDYHANWKHLRVILI